MPSAVFRQYGGLYVADTFKKVHGRSSANAVITLWTPASGKKFRLMGYSLTGSIITAFSAGVALGHAVVLTDGAISATSILSAPFVISSALQAAGPWFGTGAFHSTVDKDFHEGLLSSAADNTLRAVISDQAATPAAVAGVTGVYLLQGMVWGREE